MFPKGIFFLGVVLALGMVAGVSGCSKSSSKKENSTLKVTFLDERYNTRTPVAGVIAVLYNTDNVTPQLVKTSGADGVVDFGNIGRTTATYGWGFSFLDGTVTIRQMQTLIEGPVLNEDIYIEGGPELTPTLINVKVINIPSTATYTNLGIGRDGRLLSQSLDGSRWEVTYSNIEIFNEDLNNEGKLTFVVEAFDNPTSQSMVKYGYLADQTLTTGATYTVDMTKDPELFSWTATSAVDWVGISARYKDSWFGAGGKWYGTRSATSGSFNYAKQIPHDRSSAYANSQEIQSPASGTEKRISYTYSGMPPNNLSFQIPDYEFSGVNFNATTKVWSWTLTGTAPKDALDWEFYQSGTNTFTEWDFAVPPEKTSFTVPTLPTELSSWFDWAVTYGKEVTLMDSSNASGFKDFIRKIADSQASGDFEDTGIWRYGDYVFPTTAGAAAEEKPRDRKHGPNPFRR